MLYEPGKELGSNGINSYPLDIEIFYPNIVGKAWGDVGVNFKYDLLQPIDVAVYSGAGLLSSIAVPAIWLANRNTQIASSEMDWSLLAALREDPLKLGATVLTAGFSFATFTRENLANRKLKQLGIRSN